MLKNVLGAALFLLVVISIGWRLSKLATAVQDERERPAREAAAEHERHRQKIRREESRILVPQNLPDVERAYYTAHLLAEVEAGAEPSEAVATIENARALAPENLRGEARWNWIDGHLLAEKRRKLEEAIKVLTSEGPEKMQKTLAPKSESSPRTHSPWSSPSGDDQSR